MYCSKTTTGEAEPATPHNLEASTLPLSNWAPSNFHSVVGVMESLSLRIFNHKNEYFHYFDENILELTCSFLLIMANILKIIVTISLEQPILNLNGLPLQISIK